MCGIAGIADFQGAVEPDLVARMCDAIYHRGPDSRGIHVEAGVGLGIQRLAIIDVAGGDQPIFSEDGNVAVVMNGEIYNHLDLRAELERSGHSFSTRADTEVLVHLYEEHGRDFVTRLRGMFAFAIWDRRRRSLLLGRDRIGKKPLFWSRRGQRFWFGSELRALLRDPALPRRIDPRAIEAYLALQYVPDPMCVFEGVQKLPPACMLEVDAGGERLERYWKLDYSRKHPDMTEAEAVERILALIDESTRIRLMSEVPLGAFLSGGIDSSAVVASMAGQTSEPVKTFSIGFGDPSYDETRFARMIAERYGTDHHEFRVEPEALAIMPTMARHYGEPFADPAAIPTFYLSELTRRHVTVALNGDGGDESFAGYSRYGRGNVLAYLHRLPAPARRAAARAAALVGDGPHERSPRTRVVRHASNLAREDWDNYAISITAFYPWQRERLLSRDFAAQLDGFRAEHVLRDPWLASTARSPVDRMMEVDIETYLPGDLLPKVDVATMAHSLEGRSPFLDHVLMEFAAGLPAAMKMRGTEGKLILKRALRGRVPDEILDRPKMGFGVPLDRWFRNELSDLPQERLLDPSALGRGYLEREAIEDLIVEHRSGRADHSWRLWALLALDSWHREVADAPDEQSAPATA
jgi:asparagine synthase (glutamine-hydrolysing)